ncbi:hypothetical protein AN641_07110 [Candidatus Epulonipiscioides gigas]|nr:hypothetical protein AN641_07110 [Epulopiscium sp. SCG-C07WGA-EpuloA2]
MTKLTSISLLITIALILSLIEKMFPIFLFVPGAKLGLCNLVTLIAIYLFKNKRDVFKIIFIRVILSSFFGTNISSLIYSITGALLSFLAMSFVKSKSSSIIYISIIGAITHNIAQMVVAAIILENIYLIFYLPCLIIVAIISGFFVGAVAKHTLYYLPLGLKEME